MKHPTKIYKNKAEKNATKIKVKINRIDKSCYYELVWSNDQIMKKNSKKLAKSCDSK